MPTYDYQCAQCNNKFEVFQAMKDRPAAKCPKCGSRADRLIGGGSGVIFKGSGFYQTDYRSKSYKESAKKDIPKKEAPAAPSRSGSCSSCPTSKK